jgi:uncharacterized protein (TIGR03437 family)
VPQSVASTGAVTNVPVATLKNGIYVPVPIDLTSGTNYLILFGTGIRNASYSNANVLINSVSIVPSYLGPHRTMAGLDQVNVLLPSTLAGSGCSNVTLTNRGGALGQAEGEYATQSNTVYVCFQ